MKWRYNARAMAQDRFHWIIAFAVLLALFGLFVFGLNWLHLRPDEHLVYLHTDNSLTYTVWYQARQDVQAPLWHVFFWMWRRLVGDTEFAGRYQGVLWSMLTVSLVYVLGRSWFGAPRFGWFMMASAGVSAYFFTYAFEIRPYPVVLLSATLSMWLYWRWLQAPSMGLALSYGLSLALMAYVHYFLAFLVVMQVIYLLFQQPRRAQWWQFVAAAGLALLIWLPWSQTFVYQVNTLRQIDGGNLGIASTTTATSWGVIERLIRRATNGLLLLWGGVLLAGVWFVRRREYGLLLLWGLGVPILSLMVNNFANVYDQRYIVYMALGLTLAAGAALAALPRMWLRWLALVVFLLLNLWFLPANLPDRTPYRTIFNTMNELSEPGDVVYFAEDEYRGGFTNWNMNLYLDKALRENIVRSVHEAQGARRVWFVSSNLNAAHVQQDFEAIERTHPLERVTGKCWGQWCFVAQLLEGAPSREPVAVFEAPQYDDTLPFYGAYVDAVSGDAVAVRLWWMVDAPPVLDYSVSVRLVDDAGNVVAQVDSPPIDRDGETIRTSRMQPEYTVVDYRRLELSSGVSAGDYSLQVIVYQPVEGYNLLVGGDEILQVETITLP